MITEPTEFAAVLAQLRSAGVAADAEAAGLAYLPSNVVEVEDDTVFEANEALLERLLAVDDVDAVYTNCDGLQ